MKGVVTGLSGAAVALVASGLASPSSAAVVAESIARISSASAYNEHIGATARVGSILTVSSDDDWETAEFTATTRAKGIFRTEFYLHLGAAAPCVPLAGGECYGPLYDVAVRNQSVSFVMTSFGEDGVGSDPGIWDFDGRDLWDVLSTDGFTFEQYFFGNEFENYARIVLEDRSQRSYRFVLANAAAVPLPASALLLAGPLAALLLAGARRSRRGA